jgi:hypothetical protein
MLNENSSNEKTNFIYISKIFDKKKEKNVQENFPQEKNQIESESKNFNNIKNNIVTLNQEIVSNVKIENLTLNENENKLIIKKGRRRKNENYLNYKTARTKYAKDNLIHKFKTFFFQRFLVNLLNSLIKARYESQQFSILKFENKMIKNVTIKYNLKLMKSKISNILTYGISVKYKKYDTKNNKKILNIIKKDEFFKKILNLTLHNLYEIYISDNCQDILETNFKLNEKINNLYEDIDENQSENDYKYKLKKICRNIYTFFDMKNARKIKKKNN